MGNDIDFTALNRCQKIQEDAKIDLSTIKYFGVPITKLSKDQLITCLCHAIGTNIASGDIKQALAIADQMKAKKEANKKSGKDLANSLINHLKNKRKKH
jgi:hypothetical protein